MTQDGGYDLQPPSSPAPGPDNASGPASPTGAAAPKPGEPGWVPPVPIIEKEPDPPAEPAADPDVEQFKGLAILAYICFLIPLVAAPGSRFARFHANQGLLSFILLIVVTVTVVILFGVSWMADKLLANINLLHFFFSCGLWILQVALLVGWIALVIQGIIHAANGEKKQLPIIGHWKLLK